MPLIAEFWNSLWVPNQKLRRVRTLSGNRKRFSLFSRTIGTQNWLPLLTNGPAAQRSSRLDLTQIENFHALI
jgi:hypothetical protein